MSIFDNDFVVNTGDEFSPEFEKKRSETIRVSWILTGVFSLLGLITYIATSFFFPQYWNNLWVLLLLGPVISSGYLSYKTARMVYFSYPLTLVMFYVPLSFAYDIFGPMAWIFASIPVFYLIGYHVDRIKRIIR